MQTRHGKHGLPWVEMLIGLLLLFAVINFLLPESHPDYEKPHQTKCLSQVRQIAIAAQTYSQDHHGSYPDIHWAIELCRYLGNNQRMFHCPVGNGSAEMISYGYSGLLIRADSSGVTEKDIVAPTEVGVICDARPSRLYPNGGFIGGGGLQPESTTAVTPEPHHSGGTVVGYADGHATYVPNGYDPRDISNGVTRAFDMAGVLGLVDNPSGGISAFPASFTCSESVTVGGDPCTRAILLAAAGVWRTRAKAPIVLGGFHGQYAVQKRGANYLWGIGDAKRPAKHVVPIARDLVVVIISKHSNILYGSPRDSFSVSVWDIATVCKAFTLGYSETFTPSYYKDSIQAYTYDKNSGTRRFFTSHLGMNGKPLQFRPKTITMTDDYDMVNKVSADPYGIGYCSSAIADPNKVQIIGLRTPDGKVHFFPQDNLKSRWVMPATPPEWPLSRTLYAECGGKAWCSDGAGIANVMLAPGTPGTKALQAGPLFKASFWTP